MKLQSLAIIFIIIIMPITIVLSEYIDNKITISSLELQYDTKLLNSTYDAIKAYQLNTVNNSYSNIATTKVENIEAAAKTLLNSLATNFNYLGYQAEVMQEYVPAVVFTLYDGYYIYSPYTNQLTSTTNKPLYDSGNDQNVDNNYKDQATLNGVKPYVYYSCRYKMSNGNDFVITYTLDNYITVQGIVGGRYENKSGYLISDLSQTGNKISYKYDGNHTIDFKEDDSEQLKEFVGDNEYQYVKINGIKYYLDLDNGGKIFYIEPSGTKNYSQFQNNSEYKELLKRAITNNKSAYEYYKDACVFTDWVNLNLKDLKTTDAVAVNGQGNSIGNSEEFKIFDKTKYESSTSNFNKHRQAVIRYVVETNLSTSIAAFSSKAGGSDFLMPKISEVDWEKIENNICGIAFLQQLNLGNKKYNGYAVVANTLNEEYVSENDIYIKNDAEHTYYKVNDNLFTSGSSFINSAHTIAGVWKVNFEAKKCKNNLGIATYYFPISYKSSEKVYGYTGSYTSIMGNSGINNMIGTNDYKDMYDYINNSTNDDLKIIYYTALARERWGSYHVNNDLELTYFLDSYK